MIPPMQVNKSVSSLDHFRSQSSEGRHKHRHRVAHCLVVFVVLLAIGAIAAGSAIVVREYVLSKAYEPATCQLANVSYTSDDGECTFCSGTMEKGQTDEGSQACVQAFYPCVRVLVEYRSPEGRITGSGLLYADTHQASVQNVQCSISVCNARDREENARIVEEYVTSLPDRSFDCYYDSDTMDNVVVQKVYSRTDAIHCLLWPSLVILICALIFLYIELDRRGYSVPRCPRRNGRMPADSQKENGSPEG